VLPIIVRPCSWEDDPVINRLQVLPTDGKPVTDKRSWQERDDAWLDVVTGLKRTLLLLDQAEKKHIEAALAAQKAETDARDLTESERLAAEKRSREEQARYEQSAESQRRQEAQRLEKERLAEAKRLYKELKIQNARPVPWGRYAAMGAGVVLLLLAFWQVPKWFGDSSETQLSESFIPKESGSGSSIVQSDTTKPAPTVFDNFKPDEGKKALTVEAQKTPAQVPAEPKPKFTFNYPIVRI